MGTKKPAGGGKDEAPDGSGGFVREDAIVVDEVVAGLDPDHFGDDGFTVLIGYLDKSPAEDMYRLYLSVGMGDYVLLGNDQILKQEQVDQRSRVWLRKREVVRYVRLSSAEELAAWFLDGPISARRGQGRPTGGGQADDGGGPVAGYMESTVYSIECEQTLNYSRCKNKC